MHAPESRFEPPAIPPPAAPRALQLPGCERRLAYALQYWPGTLHQLLRPHRLRAAVATPRLSTPVRVEPRLRADWERLFDTDGRCPLLVSQSVGTLLYMRLFAQLGLNLRQLLHVQHRTVHRVSPEAFAEIGEQELDCRLQGCWRLADDKALVALHTLIRRPAAEGGELLAEVEDRFLIRRVPRADWERLPAPEGRGALRELLGLRKRQPQLDAADGLVLPLPLAPDLGRRYGQVSGDPNPVHTTRLAARLFGLPQPFAQGLALRNLIVAALHRLDAPLQSLQLSFAQPAYLGQTLSLVLQGERFELLDAERHVIAFGSAVD
jgi:hypothetical protein